MVKWAKIKSDLYLVNGGLYRSLKALTFQKPRRICCRVIYTILVEKSKCHNKRFKSWFSVKLQYVLVCVCARVEGGWEGKREWLCWLCYGMANGKWQKGRKAAILLCVFGECCISSLPWFYFFLYLYYQNALSLLFFLNKIFTWIFCTLLLFFPFFFLFFLSFR